MKREICPGSFLVLCQEKGEEGRGEEKKKEQWKECVGWAWIPFHVPCSVLGEGLPPLSPIVGSNERSERRKRIIQEKSKFLPIKSPTGGLPLSSRKDGDEYTDEPGQEARQPPGNGWRLPVITRRQRSAPLGEVAALEGGLYSL